MWANVGVVHFSNKVHHTCEILSAKKITTNTDIFNYDVPTLSIIYASIQSAHNTHIRMIYDLRASHKMHVCMYMLCVCFFFTVNSTSLGINKRMLHCPHAPLHQRTDTSASACAQRSLTGRPRPQFLYLFINETTTSSAWSVCRHTTHNRSVEKGAT